MQVKINGRHFVLGCGEANRGPVQGKQIDHENRQNKYISKSDK